MVSFRRYTISNSHVGVTVVPELGGKIVSMRNVHTGYEWMWRPGRELALFRNAISDPFEQSPLTGADECVPTVDACNWRGRDLPDHGELWAMPWRIDETMLSQKVIRTEVQFPISPLHLERRISLHEQEIAFEYRLSNTSSEAQRFLWAFHPLFPATDGTAIELPPEIEEVRATGVSGIPGLTPEAPWRWPDPVPGIRLDHTDLGSGPAYAKLFADFSRSKDGFVRVRQGGECLTFLFDCRAIPYAGIWITRKAWNGHTHLAIEPTNAGCDSLARTPETERTMVPPQGSVEWGFRVRVGDRG